MLLDVLLLITPRVEHFPAIDDLTSLSDVFSVKHFPYATHPSFPPKKVVRAAFVAMKFAKGLE